MKTFFGLIICVSLQLIYAQDSTFFFKPKSSTDSLVKGIVYEEDPRTEVLLKELRTYDIQGDVVVIDGYRIQIFFSNERKLADEQRLKFIRLFPEQETMIEYDAPNYTVKVGAFRTRDEAEDFRNIITRDFPMSIIQRHKIKMPLERDRNMQTTEPKND
jgi:hypothetical protein